MKYFIILGLLTFVSTDNSYKIDFGQAKDGADWLVVNDGVMGGLSQGEAELRDNTLYFYGKVSLENNGGFASLRTPYQDMDLSKFEKVKIKYRSRGQHIGFTLNRYRLFYFPYFKTILEPSEEWTVKEIDLMQFKTYQLLREINSNVSKKALSEIIRMGFITNDKAATSFEFEVEYIEFK